MKYAKKERVSTSIPHGRLKQMDELVKDGYFLSRQDLIKYTVSKYLDEIYKNREKDKEKNSK